MSPMDYMLGLMLILSSQLCGGYALSSVEECALCDGVRFMYQCIKTHRCPGSKCYLQVLEDAVGQLIYGGCATDNQCTGMFSAKRDDHKGQNIPLLNRNHQFLCGGCCGEHSSCNMQMCGMPMLGLYPGIHPATTTAIPATEAPVPVQCETCSGPICGIVAGQVSQCPADKPYCMNTIQNSASGKKTITKACVSVSDCETKWWRGTAGDGHCETLNVHNMYPFDFTCNLCCVRPKCNTDLLPSDKTMYGIYKQLPPTTMTTTTTTTPLSTTTTATTTRYLNTVQQSTPVQCENCSGDLCGIVPGQIRQCPLVKPYCMNTITNSANGKRIVTKTLYVNKKDQFSENVNCTLTANKATHCYSTFYNCGQWNEVEQCAAVADCVTKWWHTTASDGNCAKFDMASRYPFDFTCNFCCVLPNCNKDLIPDEKSMYGIYKQTIPTTSTTTTTTTTIPTTTTTTRAPPTPAECEVCSGNLCGVVPSQHSVSCPANTPYCMNTVVNHADGSKLITKQCGSVSDCSIKWMHGSKLEATCTTYDVTDVYPFDITCSYCCTTPFCNRQLVPVAETLYNSQ